MIKQFDTVAEYEAATPSSQESTVAHVESTNQVHIHGVNVVIPLNAAKVGDAIFLDENNEKVVIDGGSLVKAGIPGAWTLVGIVYMRRGRQVGIINKDGTDKKYLDVCQYSITEITAASIQLRLRMSPDYAVDTAIDITLSSADINATTAAEISAAVAAKATAVGDTKAWWAYLADADGNKVDSGGTQIIVQCDECVDYRFYICSMTGGTIALSVWGDMPASDKYFKNDGGWTNYWGVMNVARTREWATANGRVPTTMEPVMVTGNPAPVKPECFEDASAEGYAYTADIRAKYGTYDNYLLNGYGVMYPQRLGTFALPDAATLSATYANKTAPTKAGGTKYKFPAMRSCAALNYADTDFATGKWHLPGSEEGCYLMADATLAAIAPTIAELTTTAINNATHRWFVERYSATAARIFSGVSGVLDNAFVNSAYRVQAVTLLEVD